LYKLVQWSNQLNLAEFYSESQSRGFENNASQRVMIDCFKNESQWNAWVLYHDTKAVGSSVAHSLPMLGKHAYRICARTCVLTNLLSGTYGNALRTKTVITKHQNPTSQFFIPAQIAWAGANADLYISTNLSEVASQRSVNNTFAKLLEKTGVLKLATTEEYRGHIQNFWKLNTDLFLEQLNQAGVWK
jgi:hypothetical protein